MSGEYIVPPLVTDADEVLVGMITDYQTRVPGWAASPSDPLYLMMAVVAYRHSILLDVCTQVLDTIFRYEGTSIFGVPSEDATSAIADATFTVQDAAGPYVIPAGLRVDVYGPDPIRFTVADTVTVPVGDTSTAAGGVRLIAEDTGIEGSGLSGPIVFVDLVDYLTGATIVGVTMGGSDGETNDEYMDRLSRRATRLAPKYVTSTDLAQGALDIEGVGASLVSPGYIPATPGVPPVGLGAVAVGSGGTFTAGAKFWKVTATNASGQTLASNEATATLVLNGSATLTWTAVTGATGYRIYRATTTNGQATTPAFVAAVGAVVTYTDTGTAVSSGAIPTTNTFVVAAQTNVAGAATLFVRSALGGVVSADTRAAVLADVATNRLDNVLITVGDPTFTTVGVTWTATAFAGADTATVTAAGNAALTSYLSSATWGLTGTGGLQIWHETTVVRYGELYAILNAVDGLDSVDSIQITGVAADTNKTITGPAAVVAPGVMAGTVTAGV